VARTGSGDQSRNVVAGFIRELVFGGMNFCNYFVGRVSFHYFKGFSCSGVQMMGKVWPASEQINRSLSIRFALAMCRKFQVRMKGTA
jgi:hypothetical protein